MPEQRVDLSPEQLTPALTQVYAARLRQLAQKHDSVRAFLAEHFDEPAATQLVVGWSATAMSLSLRDGAAHSHHIGESGSFLLHIAAIPSGLAGARDFFRREYAGYTTYLSRALHFTGAAEQFGIYFGLVWGHEIRAMQVDFWLVTCLIPTKPEFEDLLGCWSVPTDLLSESEAEQWNL